MADVQAREQRIVESRGAGPSRVMSPPERTHIGRYVLRSESPKVELTWGSRMPAKPDKLKLRKRVDLGIVPIRFNMKVGWYDWRAPASENISRGGSVRWACCPPAPFPPVVLPPTHLMPAG